jgi:hypothetical protein
MFNPNPAFLSVQKLKTAPKGFTLGVKAEIEKKHFSICPKLLINAELLMALYWPPRLKKGYNQIWKVNLQLLGPMFQHLLITLGQFATQEMLKVGPKFFGP